ncbi:MAG: regulatory protein RecX [Gaiellaceae bacterium]
MVTALHARGGGRVEIELDGARWRVVPLEAVHRAGLSVGGTIGRTRARALRAEIRRQQALDAAVGTLRRREHTASSLEERLERRGVAPADRRRAVATLTRAGLVDDERYAHARAALLAERGCGNLLIADDLERHGVAASLANAAIEALEQEASRAASLVTRHGLTPATLRRLAARGFDESSLESFVAEMGGGA